MRYFWEIDYRNEPWQTALSPSQQNSQNDILVIPKINAEAPIIWDIEDSKILTELQNGVVHYKGTALPGTQGNIFITGHSSYYIWAPGNYKSIFALLDKVEAGDKIYIRYKGATFVYEVTGSKVISPDDLSVLEPTEGNVLSLMTCVPVGTNLQRLVVTAKQVSQ